MKSIFLFFGLFVGLLAAAQTETTATLQGRVENELGRPLQGAYISIKDTQHGTNTDSLGRFILQARAVFPIKLIVSYVGYAPQELSIRSGNGNNLLVQLQAEYYKDTVVITSRRRKEVLQDVPIAISVIGGNQVAEAGAFNVNRLKELVPSVQLYSSNPRNTGLSIRGLGTTFGLTNDGIDPGVGFYVDGVYYARPAATTFDFIDVERVEVLRGPQGTLFGKNTTAGAFNITTRKPTYRPGANFEVSFGNYGYVQAKASVNGPIGKKLAARLSFSGTQRDGVITNVLTQKKLNDLNNLGFRGQLLYNPTEKIEILFAADATRQRPDGYAQVIAGVAPTQRAAYRQFDQIIKDLNYKLPSTNAFDRIIDHNTTWRSGNDMGGASINADFKVGSGTITSTTAWRFWNWDPSNDRDFTGLSSLALSQAPSKHKQWSQEIRWAGNLAKSLTGVFGVFAFGQDLNTDPVHTEESGEHQWRFVQSTTSALWKTPGFLKGYGIHTTSELNTFSGAVFGQLDWAIADRLHVLGGLRYNYDRKQVDFNRQTYGSLKYVDTTVLTAAQIATLRSYEQGVYSNQYFNVEADNNNLSGQLTLAYKVTGKINAYTTFSTGYKPIGLNLGGLPTEGGKPMTQLAVIKPEYVNHYELGVKTSPLPGSTLNLVVYESDIKDYQAQVQTADLSVNRGYLANAEKVRVRGVELDANFRINSNFNVYTNIAYTDGIYESFTNAPLPLEETGAPVAFKDISGGRLPGISKWAGSLGGEFAFNGHLLGQAGKYFLAIDSYARSEFSSNPSPSKYLIVDGYALVNARFGFRISNGFSAHVWGRNIFNKNYYEQLLPGAGNAGQYAGVLGDPRTYGITLKYAL
ncbi:MAG TPA: TonB-dependent receptor [Phnomibacter sp.]|nr:TonB-dependent receptor [Phnomibacter sp.]